MLGREMDVPVPGREPLSDGKFALSGWGERVGPPVTEGSCRCVGTGLAEERGREAEMIGEGSAREEERSGERSVGGRAEEREGEAEPEEIEGKEAIEVEMARA